MKVSLWGNLWDKKREDNVVKEAASAEIQSVEKFISLISQHHHQSVSSNTEDATEYKAVMEMAVTKFRKVISLLDRGRIGHALSRKAPVTQIPISSIAEPRDQRTEQPFVLNNLLRSRFTV
ncbi:hypothetical protein ACFX13_042219 [Malus domestica]